MLTDFKNIFWLEYLHRLLGRTIGIVFFDAFRVLFCQGRLHPETPRMGQSTLLMFVLGGMQGLLGWYMVKSGLVDVTAMSASTG